MKGEEEKAGEETQEMGLVSERKGAWESGGGGEEGFREGKNSKGYPFFFVLLYPAVEVVAKCATCHPIYNLQARWQGVGCDVPHDQSGFVEDIGGQHLNLGGKRGCQGGGETADSFIAWGRGGQDSETKYVSKFVCPASPNTPLNKWLSPVR